MIPEVFFIFFPFLTESCFILWLDKKVSSLVVKDRGGLIVDIGQFAVAELEENSGE